MIIHYIKWYLGELLLKIHEFKTRKDRIKFTLEVEKDFIEQTKEE